MQTSILEDMLLSYLRDMAERGDHKAKLLLEMMENELKMMENE
tara:strand:- start:221 stop:349 length:129 start_codon:yes stop_codon:yes gene_type:complete